MKRDTTQDLARFPTTSFNTSDDHIQQTCRVTGVWRGLGTINSPLQKQQR
jgi:hypothetical protein